MPMFTSKLRPANPNYEDNDKILDKPLRSKWRFVQTWIESYRAKHVEEKDYLNYDREMAAEIHHEPVGETKLNADEKAVLAQPEKIEALR